MATNPDLCLHEEILLLALRDEEGTIASGTLYQFAISGAILADLLLQNRITVDESKRKLVNVVSSKPTGDALIDECLAKMHVAKRRASLQTWVSRFAGIAKLKHRIAEGLCDRGILREREATVLLFFTRRTYPEANPVPERELLKRLRKTIFTDVQKLDPRTVVLVSLAHRSGLLKVTFDKKRLKERKARIERIVSGDLTGHAAKAAIEAMQAAAMVAVMVARVLPSSDSPRQFSSPTRFPWPASPRPRLR